MASDYRDLDWAPGAVGDAGNRGIDIGDEERTLDHKQHTTRSRTRAEKAAAEPAVQGEVEAQPAHEVAHALAERLEQALVLEEQRDGRDNASERQAAEAQAEVDTTHKGGQP